MPRKPQTEKSVRVNLTIPSGLYEDLAEMAEMDGTSPSGLARDFVLQMIRATRDRTANAKAAMTLESMMDLFQTELQNAKVKGAVKGRKPGASATKSRGPRAVS